MAGLPFPAEVKREMDLLVPVPLAAVRMRDRGYNQAALLGGTVGAALGLEIASDTLVRSRAAGSQTTLHPGERRANVAGAFRVSPDAASRVAARHILLVDDVWTTGATALACADALLDAGARAISVVTFARALPGPEDRVRRAGSILPFQS
jgi:ComF family protein